MNILLFIHQMKIKVGKTRHYFGFSLPVTLVTFDLSRTNSLLGSAIAHHWVMVLGLAAHSSVQILTDPLCYTPHAPWSL